MWCYLLYYTKSFPRIQAFWQMTFPKIRKLRYRSNGDALFDQSFLPDILASSYISSHILATPGEWLTIITHFGAFRRLSYRKTDTSGYGDEKRNNSDQDVSSLGSPNASKCIFNYVHCKILQRFIVSCIVSSVTKASF